MNVSSVLFTVRTFGNSSGWVSRVKMLDFLNLGTNTVPKLGAQNCLEGVWI